MKNENDLSPGAIAPQINFKEVPPISFRTVTETVLEQYHAILEHCHNRLTRLELNQPGTGDSAAGLLRTFEERIRQVETIQAENTSNILRVTELFQLQLAAHSETLARLENLVKALQPIGQ